MNELPEQIQRHILDDFSGVGEGWHPLLVELNAELEKIAPDYKIYQVKEKFGQLRFYTDLYSLGLPQEDFDKAIGLINKAESDSGRICETCGEPGSLDSYSYWWKTLCPTHTEERRRRNH